ncbi:MAG: cytochrome c oxidase subunit II [Rhodomicrobiaceae bacterium]
MLKSSTRLGSGLAAGFGAMFAAAGVAAAAEGRPVDWQMNFQPPATPIAEQMQDFHNLLLVIITAITLFVLALLIWVMVRYNEKANPVPSKTSHNTMIEITWTVVPVLILLVIAIPSFRLLYAQYEFPKADLTIKATAHQWYWSYSYPDQGGFSFDSLLVEGPDLKPDQPYLLAVDNEVVVPVNKVVHVLITSNDVLHNWAVPAFGVKMDAIRGRNTAVWFQATRPGVYYGQCSELCGARHAYMPIAVRVVSEEEFAAWTEQAQQQFASTMPEPVRTAQDDNSSSEAPKDGKLASALAQ